MDYIQLNTDNSINRVVSDTEIMWDATHLCKPSALTQEEMRNFLVFELEDTPSPATMSEEISYLDGVEKIGNVWKKKWQIRLATAGEISNRKLSYLAKINTDDNRIYADVIDNKATEYTAAENAATAFKTNNYEGVVPEEVQSWADAKGWNATQATNDILHQAALWRGAANLIRRSRLKAKEDVRTSTTMEQINNAMTAWNTFVVAIRNQLGV